MPNDRHSVRPLEKAYLRGALGVASPEAAVKMDEGALRGAVAAADDLSLAAANIETEAADRPGALASLRECHERLGVLLDAVDEYREPGSVAERHDSQDEADEKTSYEQGEWWRGPNGELINLAVVDGTVYIDGEPYEPADPPTGEQR